jgi:hypothetical protein
MKSLPKPFVVRSRSAADAVAGLPLPTPMPATVRAPHVFVCAAGFEERVLHSPARLARDEGRTPYAIALGRYDTNPEDNDDRLRELLPLLQASNPSSITEMKADSPESVRETLGRLLGQIPEVPAVDVAFDVSGASVQFIFNVIGALRLSGRRVQLRILYATAKSYGPDRESEGQPPKDSSRESGVSDVVRNEMYAGFHHDGLPSFAIAFPSIVSDRLQRCLEEAGAAPLGGGERSVYWVLPSSTDESHHWRQEATKTAILRLLHGDATDESGAAALDDAFSGLCDVLSYRDALQVVIKRVDEFAGNNVSLIHLGTKMQAVGAALALGARSEVALIGARPRVFNAQSYSRGIGAAYQIDLGPLDKLFDQLLDVGTITISSAHGNR